MRNLGKMQAHGGKYMRPWESSELWISGVSFEDCWRVRLTRGKLMGCRGQRSRYCANSPVRTVPKKKTRNTDSSFIVSTEIMSIYNDIIYHQTSQGNLGGRNGAMGTKNKRWRRLRQPAFPQFSSRPLVSFYFAVPSTHPAYLITQEKWWGSLIRLAVVPSRIKRINLWYGWLIWRERVYVSWLNYMPFFLWVNCMTFLY